MLTLIMIAMALIFGGIVAAKAGNGKGLLRFPFLFAGTWTLYVTPKLYSLATAPGQLAEHYRETGVTGLMATQGLLCLIAGQTSYFCTRPAQIAAAPLTLDQPGLARLNRVAFLLGILSIGALTALVARAGGPHAFFVRANYYALELRGLNVYLIFLARLCFPAVAILLVSLSIQRQKRIVIIIAALCIYPALNSALLFRRIDSAWLMTFLGYYLIIIQGKRFGRLAAAGLSAVAVVVVIAFPLMRHELKMGNDPLDGIASIWEIGESTTAPLSPRTEAAASAARFERSNQSGGFGLGSLLWDSLVIQYVPASIVGRDVKDGLQIRPRSSNGYQNEFWDSESLNYLAPMGVTQAYEEFGYLGFLFFAALGFLYAAIDRRFGHSIRARFLHIVMIPVLLHSVANDIHTLFPRLLLFGVIARLLPAGRTAHRD